MDITPIPLLVLLQAIPFLVTIFVLKGLIFEPMWDYIEGRRQATVGAKDEIQGLESKIQARLAEYDKRLADARGQAVEIRARHRDQAARRHDELVAQARSEAEGKLVAAVDDLRRAEARAKKDLEGMAQGLSVDIVGQVLGREVRS